MDQIYENVYDSIKKYDSSPETKGTLKIETDLLLADYSSFKIGGRADIALFPKNSDAMIFCLETLKDFGVKTYVIGNGSNVLFSDEGLRGAVVFTTEMASVRFDGTKIYAECGAGITKISRMALEHSLSGLEFACGIPGSLGGAVYMNAGAYGGQMSDVVVESTYYDMNSRTVKKCIGDEHSFDYRKSVYMGCEDKVLLCATMQLSLGIPGDIKSVMDANLRARREKQPLEFPSAGSAFKRYPGYYTGKLIEEAGLKGYSVGGAQVSEKHAGFIINRGSATANDVKALISHIKNTIYQKHGIMLECEVRFID